MRLHQLAATLFAFALLCLSSCAQIPSATLTQVHDFTAFGGRAPNQSKATSAGLDARALWDKHLAAVAACKSVKVAGTSKSKSETTTVNIAGTCDGSNSKMQVSFGTQTLEVITVAGTYYVKGNSEFWRASGASQAVINAIGSRYLSTTDQSMAGVTIQGFLKDLRDQATAGTADVTATPSTAAGMAVYELVRGARTSASSMTVWVTVQSSTPIRAVVQTPTESSDYTFSDWDAVAPFSAPPASQVVKV